MPQGQNIKTMYTKMDEIFHSQLALIIKRVGGIILHLCTHHRKRKVGAKIVVVGEVELD